MRTNTFYPEVCQRKWSHSLCRQAKNVSLSDDVVPVPLKMPQGTFFSAPLLIHINADKLLSDNYRRQLAIHKINPARQKSPRRRGTPKTELKPITM